MFSILDAWRGSEYACVQISSNNILCHHNKRLMGYFEFLYGSVIICLPLNIPEKLHWQHLFEKPEETGIHRLYLSWYDAIPMRPEEQHLPFKQMGTTTTFSFGYQSCVWPRSGSFFWQNPCSGCNSGIDLVFSLEYTFFQLCSNAEQISFRLERFRRSYVKHPSVTLSSHTSYTAFLLDVCCAIESDHFPFFAAVCPRW